MTCLFTREEVDALSVDELDSRIDEAFRFDSFASQYENRVELKENFRADGLNRILYRCPACCTDGAMEGKGTLLTCHHCGKQYEMDIYGRMRALVGETEFAHIPDWYDWQRKCVRRELLNGSYKMELPVDIGILADHKALYMVGSGTLVHDIDGFTLTDSTGKLHYTQASSSCYTLNADFYWYQIGDVIGIGNKERLYYCFPKAKDVVTKARLATEELYKLRKRETADVK